MWDVFPTLFRVYIWKENSATVPQLSLSEELAGTYKVYIKPWGLSYPEQTDTQT